MTSTPQPPPPEPEQAPEPGQQPAPIPQPPPPVEKRDTTMAMLAHLLMIVPGIGILGPLIIWLIKKDEDKYVNFHGKQALLWAIAVMIVSLVSFIICIGPFIVGLANLVYVIIAAVKVNKGEPFKYILVADWFCKDEFAAAYPAEAAKAAQQAPQPPQQQPPQQQ